MSDNQERKKISFKGIGIGLISLGWEIAIPIFGGVILGYYLDNWLNEKYVFKISLLAFGIFLAYYNVYKRINLEMLRKKMIDEQKSKDNITK